jgi:hypothetical protein
MPFFCYNERKTELSKCIGVYTVKERKKMSIIAAIMKIAMFAEDVELSKKRVYVCRDCLSPERFPDLGSFWRAFNCVLFDNCFKPTKELVMSNEVIKMKATSLSVSREFLNDLIDGAASVYHDTGNSYNSFNTEIDDEVCKTNLRFEIRNMRRSGHDVAGEIYISFERQLK